MRKQVIVLTSRLDPRGTTANGVRVAKAFHNLGHNVMIMEHGELRRDRIKEADMVLASGTLIYKSNLGEAKVIALHNWGFEAHVELVRIADGAIMGKGSAICGNDEESWAASPAYAKRSMAVTRATGKACRMAFGWLMSLAGYESTPKEEMDSLKRVANPPKQPYPRMKRDKTHDGDDSTDEQRRHKVMKMLMEMYGDHTVDVKNALVGISMFTGTNKKTHEPEQVSCDDISKVQGKWLKIIYDKTEKQYKEWKKLTDTEKTVEQMEEVTEVTAEPAPWEGEPE